MGIFYYIYNISTLRIIALSRHFHDILQVVIKVQKASNSMLELLETERKACGEGLNISKFVDKFATDVVMQLVLDMNDKQLQEHSDAVLRYERESNWSAAADNQIGGLASMLC